VKNSTSDHSSRGLMPPNGPNGPSGRQRQDDDRHDAETGRGAKLLVIDPSDQRMEARLFDKEQRR